MKKSTHIWKRGRTVLCVLLALVLITTTLTAEGIAVTAKGKERVFDIGVNDESVTATLDDTGLLTISGSGRIKDFTPETAPFRGLHIKGLKIGADITAIGDYTFYNCGPVTGRLSLPKGLLRIGDYAFSGTSQETALKPDFVENPFTQARVTRKKTGEDPDGEASPSPAPSAEPSAEPTPGASSEAAPAAQPDPTPAPTPEPASEPVSEPTPEPESGSAEPGEPETVEAAGGMAETSQTEFAAQRPGEEEQTEASGQESDSAEAPAPTETPASSAPSDTSSGDGEKQYLVETVTEQEIGTGIFFARTDQPAFTCSETNNSFRTAMRTAGYQEAEDVVSAVFACCDSDAAVVKTLPVVGGSILLPELLPEFTAPESGGLYSSVFAGWTESRDEAHSVRRPGTLFPVEGKEDLYFIAHWDKQMLVKIAVEQQEGAVLFTVPEAEGYEFVAYRWQTSELPAGLDILENEGLISWSDIPGQTEKSYRRVTDPSDADRVFRCIVTARKKQGLVKTLLMTLSADNGEETLFLDAVRGLYVAAEGMIGLYPGSYAGSGEAVIAGNMAPVIPENGGFITVPDCEFTCSGVDNLVFNGWLGSDNNRYDPGVIVNVEEENLTALTAQWEAAHVVYVAQGGSGSGSREAPYGSLGQALASPSLTGATPYTNVVVLLTPLSESAGTLTPPEAGVTVTSCPPGEASENRVLSVSGSVRLGGPIRFESITLAGGADGALFGEGYALSLGRGVETTGSLTLTGGGAESAFSGPRPFLTVSSGSYANIYGGGSGGASGEVHLSGEAAAQNVYGGAGSISGVGRVWLTGGTVTGDVFGGNETGSATSAACFVMLTGGAEVQGSVYGGGDQGTVMGLGDVKIYGGSVAGSVYGGGKGTQGSAAAGALDGNSSVSVYGGRLGTRSGAAGEVIEPGTGNVYGGGQFAPVSFAGSVLVETSDEDATPAIGGSVFGGGAAGFVGLTASVEIRSGAVGGSVYGGGQGAAASVNESSVTVSGTGTVYGDIYGGGALGAVADTATVSIGGGSVKNVYGGGEGSRTETADAGRVKNTAVTVSGGVVDGSVFGGGNLGVVGSGSDLASDGAVRDGSVSVTVTGGTVRYKVFGGGFGQPGSALGSVFGHTQVTVSGGEVQSDVFGGGNYGTVTGNTAVTVQAQESAVTVGGNVYGGGNLGQSIAYEGNTWLVRGASTVLIDGTAPGVTFSGAAVGGGALTEVQGSRQVTVQNFADLTMAGVQRASLARLTSSRVTLTGCGDAGDDEGDVPYALSQLDELRLCGTTLILQDKAREVAQLKNCDASGNVSTDESTCSEIHGYPSLVVRIGASTAYGGFTFGAVSGAFRLVLDGEGALGMAVRGSTASSATFTGEQTINVSTPKNNYKEWAIGDVPAEEAGRLLLTAVRDPEGGYGVAQATYTLSTSAKSYTYSITECQLPEGITLVMPTVDDNNEPILDDPTGDPGSTFGLEITPSGSQWTGTSSTSGWYLLSQAPWSNDVDYVLNRSGSGAVASLSANGKNAELTFTLIYRKDYETFTGGQISLTLEERDKKNTATSIPLLLILQGEQGVTARQTAAVARGRSFTRIETEETAIVPQGAVTAGFQTEYYPTETGASGIGLALCRLEGETPVQVDFPAGARIVLGDMTVEDSCRYYYSVVGSGNTGTLSLAGFSDLAAAGVTYPGPADTTSLIREKLQFAVDFSVADVPPAAGSYCLMLTHGEELTDEGLARAAFTVADVSPALYSVTLTRDPSSTETRWVMTVSADTPEQDTRYAEGASIHLSVTRSDGGAPQAVSLPEDVRITADGRPVVRDQEGQLSLILSRDGEGQFTARTVVFDLSQVEQMAAGTYAFTAVMRPRVGLQLASDRGLSNGSSATLSYALTAAISSRERLLSLARTKGRRLVDASAEDPGDRQFAFDLDYRDLQSGDTLVAELLKKTGATPKKSSYEPVPDAAAWSLTPIPSGLTLAGGSLPLSFTVPLNEEPRPCTYRLVVKVLSEQTDPDTGERIEAASQYYNFIVK